jgi:hypothetical protein
MKEETYLHVSYVCCANNITTFGDGVVSIDDKVTMQDIKEHFLNCLQENRPDLEWSTPTIISIQPLSKKLALQLNPDLKKE